MELRLAAVDRAVRLGPAAAAARDTAAAELAHVATRRAGGDQSHLRDALQRLASCRDVAAGHDAPPGRVRSSDSHSTAVMASLTHSLTHSLVLASFLDDDANIVPQPTSIPFLEHLLSMNPDLMNGAQVARMYG